MGLVRVPEKKGSTGKWGLFFDLCRCGSLCPSVGGSSDDVVTAHNNGLLAAAAKKILCASEHEAADRVARFCEIDCFPFFFFRGCFYIVPWL